MMILPRQARDKHTETQKQTAVFSQARRAELSAAAALSDQQRAAETAAAIQGQRSDQQGQDQEEGCGVTFEYSNGDVYVGEMRDGVPSGVGTMQYSDDGSSDRLESSLVTYEGEWLNGKHHGKGKKDWCVYIAPTHTCQQQTATWQLPHLIVLRVSASNAATHNNSTFYRVRRLHRNVIRWLVGRGDGILYEGEYKEGKMHGEVRTLRKTRQDKTRTE